MPAFDPRLFSSAAGLRLKERGRGRVRTVLTSPSAAALMRLGRRPLAAQPLPGRLAFLFPEHRLKSLNAGRDRTLILARVLENGGFKDVAWARRRYGPAALRRFLAEDGARLVSRRSLGLWRLIYRVRPRPTPAWRKGYWP